MNHILAPSKKALNMLSAVALTFLERYNKINVAYEYIAVFYSLSASYSFHFLPFYASHKEIPYSPETRTKRQLFDQCVSVLSLLGLEGFEIIDKNGKVVTDSWEKEDI
jgi:hypothetical protein